MTIKFTDDYEIWDLSRKLVGHTKEQIEQILKDNMMPVQDFECENCGWLEDEISSLEDDKNDLQDEINALECELHDAQDEIRRLQSEIGSLESELMVVEKELAEYGG